MKQNKLKFARSGAGSALSANMRAARPSMPIGCTVPKACRVKTSSRVGFSRTIKWVFEDRDESAKTIRPISRSYIE